MDVRNSFCFITKENRFHGIRVAIRLKNLLLWILFSRCFIQFFSAHSLIAGMAIVKNFNIYVAVVWMCATCNEKPFTVIKVCETQKFGLRIARG